MDINYRGNRNRRKWLSILVLLACLSAIIPLGYGQESLQVHRKHSFLWSMVTGKNTTYLLGSLHVLKGDVFPLPRAIEEAYSDCQKIILETDLDSINDPAFRTQMISLGLYPDGQTLKKNVSEQTYESFRKKVDAIGLSIAHFDRLRPWVCALILTFLEFQRLGFDPSYGIDTYFFHRAKEDEKEVIPLESAEYQLKLFTTMDEAEQESFLRQTLKDLEVIETMASEMVEAWKTGDVDKLNSIIGISFREHPVMYERFIIQRNRKWTPQIENLMKQDVNALVIVGAGHLVGAESIVELLKKRGYKIVQR